MSGDLSQSNILKFRGLVLPGLNLDTQKDTVIKTDDVRDTGTS